VIKKSTETPNLSSANSNVLMTIFVVFLTLKLTGNIDWSWWWVTSPLWIPIAAALILIVIALVFYNTGK